MAVVEFQCCTFSFCYVDMVLDMPVKILYDTCYNQNIGPVVLNKTHSTLFSLSPTRCTVLTTIMMSRMV